MNCHQNNYIYMPNQPKDYQYPFKISVAISTYNRDSFLKGLMDSILQQTLSPREFEIIFVNNNSTDNTDAICKQFIADHPSLKIQYHIEYNQGLSFARNRCIQEAKGKYITFADDDALLNPDFLETVCNYLDEHTDIAEVGGPIFLSYMESIPNWENPYINTLFGYFQPSLKPYILNRPSKKYPRGSNMTYRTEIFNTCGLFNTSLGRIKQQLIGGEEKDIAFRIINAGFRIAYIPSAIVHHLVPERRTKLDFIQKQAKGIGLSEQIRTLNISRPAYLKAILLEGMKWIASFILCISYILRGKPQKGGILLYFRWFVTQGLLFK